MLYLAPTDTHYQAHPPIESSSIMLREARKPLVLKNKTQV